MADEYTAGFDNISAQESDKFEGDFEGAGVANPLLDIGGIEEEMLSLGGFVTDEGFTIGIGDMNMSYMPDPDFLKIDRMARYISSLFNKGLTKSFWAENVLPPLRTAFRDIFTKVGPKDWSPNRKGTAIFKTAFGLKSQRRLMGGGHIRPMNFTGEYRGALVVTKAFWNRKGNLFIPLSDTENISRRFSEIYADAGIDGSGKWSKGFSWGVDLDHFTEHARKFWTGVRKHVDTQRDITPKDVEGNTRRHRIIKWLYTHGVNEKQEINDFFREREQQGASYPFFRERPSQGVFLDKTYDIKARPVFGYFRTVNNITNAFYRKVEKNFLSFISRNLSKGARDNWYGGPGNITRSGSPLEQFKQPFRAGGYSAARLTPTGDVTTDDIRVSQQERAVMESDVGEEWTGEQLLEKVRLGEELSPGQYMSAVREAVQRAESVGMPVSQREMAGALDIPMEGLEFDDE